VMDTGDGRFAEIRKEVADQIVGAANGNKDKVPIFTVGETMVIRGSSFEVRNLDAFTGLVVLKLLPRNGHESLKNGLGERSEGN
jgi:hypothetical protein